MAVAYRAGAARLPFGMLRGYIGTDLAKQNPRIRHVNCPYTGERIATVPAVNPDVTILHAQRADRRGNVAIDGIVGAAREAALAATKLIVTVETIVDELPAAMNNVVPFPSRSRPSRTARVAPGLPMHTDTTPATTISTCAGMRLPAIARSSPRGSTVTCERTADHRGIPRELAGAARRDAGTLRQARAGSDA